MEYLAPNALYISLYPYLDRRSYDVHVFLSINVLLGHAVTQVVGVLLTYELTVRVYNFNVREYPRGWQYELFREGASLRLGTICRR